MKLQYVWGHEGSPLLNINHSLYSSTLYCIFIEIHSSLLLTFLITQNHTPYSRSCLWNVIKVPAYPTFILSVGMSSLNNKSLYLPSMMYDTAFIIFSNNVAFLLMSCISVDDTTIHLIAQVGSLEADFPYSLFPTPNPSLSPIKSIFRNIIWISLLVSITPAITFYITNNVTVRRLGDSVS